MNNRRRFLHILGASAVGVGAGWLVGCGGDEGSPVDPAGSAGSGGGQGGSASGAGGNAAGAAGEGQGGEGQAGEGQGGEGGQAGEGQAGSGQAGSAQGGGGQGGSAGSGTGLPPGVAVGPPSAFAGVGLHIASGKKIIVGHDDGGFYALEGLCTHKSCDMSGTKGQLLSNGDLKCVCHGSVFAPDGSVVKGPAVKALPAYAMALGSDGQLYVDKTSKVDASVRLVVEG